MMPAGDISAMLAATTSIPYGARLTSVAVTLRVACIWIAPRASTTRKLSSRQKIQVTKWGQFKKYAKQYENYDAPQVEQVLVIVAQRVVELELSRAHQEPAAAWCARSWGGRQPELGAARHFQPQTHREPHHLVQRVAGVRLRHRGPIRHGVRGGGRDSQGRPEVVQPPLV
jgi:hypothetical protein